MMAHSERATDFKARPSPVTMTRLVTFVSWLTILAMMAIAG